MNSLLSKAQLERAQPEPKVESMPHFVRLYREDRWRDFSPDLVAAALADGWQDTPCPPPLPPPSDLEKSEDRFSAIEARLEKLETRVEALLSPRRAPRRK